RRAERLFRAVEDAHRFLLQAAENAAGEVSAAEAEIATAVEIAQTRPDECLPEAVERLREAGAELRAASAGLPRRPRTAIEVVARARETRD
ncbi:hypothetical protein ABTC46_18355, partial [Acinetobacter baumannii]